MTRPRKRIPPAAPKRRLPPPDERVLAAGAWGAAGVALASGAAMALAYARRDGAAAHASVAAMPAVLRGAHAWGATALVVLLLALLVRAWVRDRSRLAPSRAWIVPGVSLVAALLAVQTGAILAWDHDGWQGWVHARSALDALPGVDVPPPGVEDAPLPWLFWAHALVPLAALALAVAWTRPWEEMDKKKGMIAGLAVVGVAVLAAIAPPAVGPPPMERLPEGRPPWPFLWLVPLQDALGPVALWALPVLGGLAAAALALGRAWPKPARLALLWGAAAAVAALSVVATLR